MSEAIRFDIPPSAIPTHWYNVQADLPRPLPPVLHPGHASAGGTGRPGAAFPDAIDYAGGQPGSLD